MLNQTKKDIFPTVQVLLSTYNGGSYLEEQIDSILSQKNINVICSVRDDGSQDYTKDILEKYKHNFPEKTEIIYGNNIGFSKSFSSLVDTSGDFQYFAFSDQDDVWLPEKLSEGVKCIDGFSKQPEMCFCNGLIVNDKLEVQGKMFDSMQLPTNKIGRILENKAAGCTIVFNRAARDFFLEADQEKIIYHDFWMYVICSYFGKVVYDPIPRIKYRQHQNNQVGSKPKFSVIWKRRIKQLTRKTHVREFMAVELLNKFGNKLSVEEQKELKLLAEYRKSLRNTFSLLFSFKIFFPDFKKNFWLKMHVILRNI